jgi:hypothetical protein
MSRKVSKPYKFLSMDILKRLNFLSKVAQKWKSTKESFTKKKSSIIPK